MTTLARAEDRPMETRVPTLATFLEHFRYSNPFASNRVVPATPVTETADQVHRAAFNRLTVLATGVGRQSHSAGALLWGEAGIGKSHLLGRLANWAGADDKQAVFIYLANLQAQPEQMPRSLLRCIVSILTRGRTTDFASTPLYRIVRSAVKHALRDDGRRHEMASAEAAYFALVDDLCAGVPAAAALVDRPTYALLWAFFRSVYLSRNGFDDRTAGLVVRWLSGDPLEPAEARILGIASDGRDEETVTFTDDEQVKRVLVAVARLAGIWRRPFILCLDQIDNLEREQFAALSRFLHALLDGASNLLVITAGVRDTVARWEDEGVLTKAARDRLAQHVVELQRVGVAEARQITQCRLQPFQEPFLGVPEIKELVQTDYLFPLGEAWARARLGDKFEVRPRDVISWAAEEWRRRQDLLDQVGDSAWLANWHSSPPSVPVPAPPTPDVLQALVDGKVDAKLREHVRQRQLEPQTLPPDADNMSGLLYSLLKQEVNASGAAGLASVERQQRPKYGTRPTYDLKLRHRGPSGDGETVTGLLCLVVGNRTSMSGYLRRLAQDEKPPQRVFLVTEERRPLDPAAAGGRYLEQVRDRHGDGFRHVELTFDQYAALDALQAVIGQARSGDLEVEVEGGHARRVSESEVIESYHRTGQLSDHPLLRHLLDTSAAVASPVAAEPVPADAPGAGQDLREFIMGRVGVTASCSSVELAAQYREYLKALRRPLPAMKECRARVEEAAARLHREGMLVARARDDGLYLSSN